MRMTRAALRARAAEGEMQDATETSPCRMTQAASPWKQLETTLVVHEDETGDGEECDLSLHRRQGSAELADRVLRDITMQLNERVLGDGEEKEFVGADVSSDPFVEHVQPGEGHDEVEEHVNSTAEDVTTDAVDLISKGIVMETSDAQIGGPASATETDQSEECEVPGQPAIAQCIEEEVTPRQCPSPESEKLAASFDAMDKLEDELEQVDTELKATASRRVTIVSPAKFTATTPLTRKAVSAAISKRRSTPYRSLERARTEVDSPLARPESPFSPLPQKVVTPKSILRGRTPKEDTPTPLRHKRATSTPLPVKLAAKSQSPSADKTPAKTTAQTHKRRVTSTTTSLNHRPSIPAKSSKPATLSTFQLPGEVTAARLKAAKEEREARRAAGQIVSARPTVSTVAKSTKPITTPTFSLPGEETAARLKAQKEEREVRRAAGVVPAPETKPVEKPRKSSKPPTICTFQLSSEATAAKLKIQKEEREARRAAAAVTVGQCVSVPTARAPRPSLAIKSNKPLTTSTFALSSETTAARLKAQKEDREARRAAQEEKEKEEAEKERLRKSSRGHSSRVLSTSMKPSIVPRENKASKIRIASGGSHSKGEDKENTAPLKL